MKTYQITAMVFVMIACLYIWTQLGPMIEEKQLANIREHIGETLIVSGDTLMVITYDFNDSKFVLSNDVKVSEDFLNVYDQLK